MKMFLPKTYHSFYFLIFVSIYKSLLSECAYGEESMPVTEKATNPLKHSIKNVILYSRTLQSLNPFTIRLVDFCTESIYQTSSEICESFQDFAKITGYSLGTNYSRFLEPDIRKAMTLAEGAIQMSAFFTVIFACNPSQFSNLSTYIKQTVNPKSDFTLFVLNPTEFEVHQQLPIEYNIDVFPVFAQLLHKLIIKIDSALTSPSIWIECLVNCFSKTKLIQILDVPESPLKNPRMGYNLRSRHLLISASDSPPYI